MWEEFVSSEIIIGVSVVVICIICYYFFFSSCNPPGSDANYYFYHNSCGDVTGPMEWKKVFPHSNGDLQSPVNLSPCEATAISADRLPCLMFSTGYNLTPDFFRLYNDGHTVVLHFRFPNDTLPTICGGPLTSAYQFYNACFRWGPNEYEGSEHTINCHRYALELQAMHIRTDKKYFNIQSAIDDGAILIISYFFEVVDTDNIYLHELTKSLTKISKPFSSIEIEPLPISCIMPIFRNKYYVYCGSLTYPPCSEAVKWIVQPETLPISQRQLNKFQNVCGLDGPILLNTRPVQKLNSRPVLFYI